MTPINSEPLYEYRTHPANALSPVLLRGNFPNPKRPDSELSQSGRFPSHSLTLQCIPIKHLISGVSTFAKYGTLLIWQNADILRW